MLCLYEENTNRWNSQLMKTGKTGSWRVQYALIFTLVLFVICSRKRQVVE